MRKNMKRTIKLFLFFIQLGLLCMFSNNIFKFFVMDKCMISLSKFIIENVFLLFIFILNIRAWILIKSEDEKRRNTCLIYSSILAVIYFMNNIVIYNYIEGYIFYAVSVIYMLYIVFKMYLVGEKYTTYKFKITKINKIIIVIALLLTVIGQVYYIYNIQGEITKLNQASLSRLFVKEKIKVVGISLFILEMLITEFALKENKQNSKIRALNGVIYLVISVFSVKRSLLNCIGQVVITKYFLNNYLEVKKKRELV